MITLTTLAEISRLQHNLITGNRAIGQSGNRAIGQSGNRAIGQSVRLMSSALTANPLLSSYLFDWHSIKNALINLGSRDGCPQPSANSTSKQLLRPTNGCIGTCIPTSIRIANEVLTELQLEKHPGKTFIGKLSRGFETLGYQFNEQGFSGPSKTTEFSAIQKTQFGLMSLVETTVSVVRDFTFRSSTSIKPRMPQNSTIAQSRASHPCPKNFLNSQRGCRE